MTYASPLATRYASPEMGEIFSRKSRALIWRELWIALARAQGELGLPITEEQIAELEANKHHINFETIAENEKETRHDVVAHLQAYAALCPKAAPILHLGATSAYVTDNGDLLLLQRALQLLLIKVVDTIRHLARFADHWAEQPCLAYTHLQPAQPTTIGKRACLWIQDLLLDLDEVERRLARLQLLGAKGATGTQAAFLQLFDGDTDKVAQLDARVCEILGISSPFPISGQTYTRKQDTLIFDTLTGIAGSASKFAVDIRLLMAKEELLEPRATTQIGSSAMPHKRNPVRCERMTSLARFVTALSSAPKETHANQWLERSLDDSAGRRLYLPEGFLAVDGILNLYLNVSNGLEVNIEVVQHNLKSALPALSAEPLLIEGAKAGRDRLELHEELRERLDEGEELETDLSPRELAGCAGLQTHDFLSQVVAPALTPYEGLEAPSTTLRI